MASLELKCLKKSYGQEEVIHGVDMDVRSGEFCVFVGPSGCGKSTLLRMIAGLESITHGQVCIDGEVVNHLPAAQRGLAMVFQSYALYPHMSVRQNLSFGLENLRFSKAEIQRRVGEAAKMLQIETLLSRRPGQLSGGQRQRVAIGRTLVRAPKIFLFDEPLSNLDAELRGAMRTEIAALHRRLGNTMIYVTHDQVEAMTMADKIAVLRAGRVEQFGAPLDLYNHPANKFVAGFIGTPRMNFLEVRKGESGKIVLPGGKVVLAPRAWTWQGGTASLGIRAHHLKIHDGGELAFIAKAVEQLGGETYIYGTVEGQDMTLHLPGQAVVQPGEGLRLKLDLKHIHLFAGDV